MRTPEQQAQDKYRASPKFKEAPHKLKRERKRARIDKLKAAPCMDCGGQFKPHQMDFDHVRGEKKFGISRAICANTAYAKLLEEIAKCDLVCANCHRDRTHKRKYPSVGRKRLN